MRRILFFFLCLFSTSLTRAQTGVIRGIVTDKVTELPLQGVTVVLENGTRSVLTDKEGRFDILGVPTGRQTIIATYVGYESASIPDIDIITGKEVNLSIGLSERFNRLAEVTVKAVSSKMLTQNKMVAVSGRQFGIEEVSRYSGGRSDVARLAANFAGVSAPDDSRNDIVIRGNSSTGLLWRIEGIPVPSPNHFSTLGTTGSPVSALNPHLLSNSDFITSAFPAEYGNALGGVFDLSFRKGNVKRNEFAIGVGAFPGLEGLAEGRLGKKGGSFVVAGRYAIAGLLGSAGGTSAPPTYTDLSFNIDFGKSKIGNISLFGIAGNAKIDLIGKDIKEDDLFAFKDEDGYVKSGFGVAGLKHIINLGSKSFIKTVIGSSFSSNSLDNYRYFDYQTTQERKLENIIVDNSSRRITLSSYFNTKVSNRISVRTGLLFESFKLKAKLFTRERQDDSDSDGYPDYVSILSNKGRLVILQPFAQAQFRLTEVLTFNGGIHTQYFSVNGQWVAEPRAAFSWAIDPKNSIHLGYGLHHQNVAEPLLFLNEEVNGQLVQTNRKLDLVQSGHFVIGYDTRWSDKWRSKVELYYQRITKAAVQRLPSGYSSLTEGAEFIFSTDKSSLVSNGTGFNRGVEITIEKFYNKGYHALLTSSVFESKIKGSDGIERNSPFNNKYVLNVLGGREFKIGRKKTNVFSLDTKITTSGGRHYTPIDLQASRIEGYEIKETGQEFTRQYRSYFRMDLKLGMKFNSKNKKCSHQFYLDLQNITDNDNVFIYRYNRLEQKIDELNQIGFFPDFGYRFQF